MIEYKTDISNLETKPITYRDWLASYYAAKDAKDFRYISLEEWHAAYDRADIEIERKRK